LPVKVTRRKLADLVRLIRIHIHTVHRDKIAYVGYQFVCAWEAEHGLGMLTHRDRVVQVGHASTAFVGWIADEDRSRRKRARRL